MRKLITLLAFTALLFGGCEEISQTLNMINCKYKIQDVGQITWAGINLTGITSASDLSASDLLKAGQAIANQDFNVAFSLNVLGSNETEQPAKIQGFDYILLLNENEITNGEHSHEVTINPGETGILPVNMRIDAAQLFSGESIEGMIDLVKNMTNYGEGKESDIALKFSPWIPLGNSVKKMPYITLNHTLQ